MTKLEAHKPVLIQLYGYPGSGKSFIARQLTDHLRAAHINAEKIRMELFDKPGYDAKENTIVNNIMEYMSGEFLRAGISVIYDSDSHQSRRRRNLRNMAEKIGGTNLLVWIQIDLESAFARVAKRDRRRIDDRFSPSLDRASFDSLVASMQPPVSGEGYVVVSGKHNFKTQLSAIVKRLRELGLVDTSEADKKIIKPGLINLIPKTNAGRVDMSRRNINIR